MKPTVDAISRPLCSRFGSGLQADTELNASHVASARVGVAAS